MNLIFTNVPIIAIAFAFLRLVDYFVYCGWIGSRFSQNLICIDTCWRVSNWDEMLIVLGICLGIICLSCTFEKVNNTCQQLSHPCHFSSPQIDLLVLE